ncbi:hypothetical protein ABTK45_19690, partial [Acinetobacter baumannii]
AQNQASRDIKTAENNGVNGNPLSASSQRMQADVQRNVNQEKRIENGLQSGKITTREAGLLERDEAKVNKLQAKDLKDGKLSAGERRELR